MSSSSRIEALLESVTIRGTKFPNRVIMSPMTRGASPNGVPSAEVAAYYARRAAGGVGAIFTESVFIEDKGTMGKFDLEGGDDKKTGWPVMFGEAPLEGWRRVVDEVHAAGGADLSAADASWHSALAGQGPELVRYSYFQPERNLGDTGADRCAA